MALSSSNHFDRTINTTMELNPSRKVRVVAKIRGFTDREAEFASGVSWISVNKPNGEASESVTVSFGDQSVSRKDSYEVDYCYEQNEDNDFVFSREVEPLVSGVFNGCNATVIAYGARNTGKTSVIQGSCEKPGLAALAMTEILSVAEDNGKSVAISFYEVHQDRVCDLLDPKQPAVFVLEDAKGKIQLKGLSQVPVKSISDFRKLYVGFDSRKPTPKIASELPRRSHKGLIVHVSSHNENPNNLPTAKMNFVDLAGYEDVRKKSIDGLNVVEQSKINQSIYAFVNVLHALNANESHVPYRESKLTRMLQDSLGGINKVLMITCLNPTFCQDSISTVKLASRSCQKNNKAVLDSTRKIHSLTKTVKISSKKSHVPRTVSATAKKQASSRVLLSQKKAKPFAVQGRKLFDEASHLTPSEKVNSALENVSIVETIKEEEGKPVGNVKDVTLYLGDENTFPAAPGALEHIEHTFLTGLEDTEPTSIVERDNLSTEPQDAQFTSTVEKDVCKHGEGQREEFTPSLRDSTNTMSLKEDKGTEKENGSSLVDDDKSPPISVRLRELSNNLKALCSATPSYLKTTEKNEVSSYALVPIGADIVEPKTPVIEPSTRAGDVWDANNINSPWQTCSMRSSGMKNSLVQECLRILNTADKEELKKLKGIGEKRSTYILELREESPEPFKNLDDLKDIGLSAKQIKALMKTEVGRLFD
ncbi:Kinesin-like protein [Trema orientale]|uniref:Kinesin-like protein n=1 Tax=Trema orientale TaxID=63057 RepID=A0A2P5B5X5_TREOI|nr:Kinesin-like protein [Trema orientale]